MGRGDNRRSPKHRQRRAWRRLKMRLRKRKEGAGPVIVKTPVRKR